MALSLPNSSKGITMEETVVAPQVFEDIAIEELGEVAGAGTTNTGGTFGTAGCPACIGTAFSFT
jgi:hypothetical protein